MIVSGVCLSEDQCMRNVVEKVTNLESIPSYEAYVGNSQLLGTQNV